MAVLTPTTPTFLSPAPIPVAVLADGAIGTVYTLDLRTKFGAWLLTRIGRRAATALTRAGYVAVRRTFSGGFTHPSTAYDRVSNVAAAASTTVASGGASGTNTVVLTSATGFSIGDTICLHSDDSSANRVEFSRITGISTNTLTVERNFTVSHNAGDRVTNQADVFDALWVPGGDQYAIYAVNSSGQGLVFHAEAETYDSDTIT